MKESETLPKSLLDQVLESRSTHLLATAFNIHRSQLGDEATDLESVIGILHGEITLCLEIMSILAANIVDPATGKAVNLKDIIPAADSSLMEYLKQIAELSDELEKIN